MSWPDRKRHLEIILWKGGLGHPINIYIEPRDRWIGYFRGDDYHYVCPLPCVVIRWGRRK